MRKTMANVIVLTITLSLSLTLTQTQRQVILSLCQNGSKSEYDLSIPSFSQIRNYHHHQLSLISVKSLDSRQGQQWRMTIRKIHKELTSLYKQLSTQCTPHESLPNAKYKILAQAIRSKKRPCNKAHHQGVCLFPAVQVMQQASKPPNSLRAGKNCRCTDKVI